MSMRLQGNSVLRLYPQLKVSFTGWCQGVQTESKDVCGQLVDSSLFLLLVRELVLVLLVAPPWLLSSSCWLNGSLEVSGFEINKPYWSFQQCTVISMRRILGTSFGEVHLDILSGTVHHGSFVATSLALREGWRVASHFFGRGGGHCHWCQGKKKFYFVVFLEHNSAIK